MERQQPASGRPSVQHLIPLRACVHPRTVRTPGLYKEARPRSHKINKVINIFMQS